MLQAALANDESVSKRCRVSTVNVMCLLGYDIMGVI